MLADEQIREREARAARRKTSIDQGVFFIHVAYAMLIFAYLGLAEDMHFRWYAVTATLAAFVGIYAVALLMYGNDA